MRIAALIARLLLGLIFVVFGLNGFLNFIPMGPMPTGLAGQFIGALRSIPLLRGCGGATDCRWCVLLVNRYVALGLVLLGPVIVNIFLYHLFLNPVGMGMAVLVIALWFIVFYAHRQAFSGIFAQRG